MAKGDRQNTTNERSLGLKILSATEQRSLSLCKAIAHTLDEFILLAIHYGRKW